MGNKTLKIALPLIILGFIAFVIYRTQKSIDESAPAEVGAFNFSAYISKMVLTDLNDKPYAQAYKEYHRIYDVIKTEESIIPKDSLGNRQIFTNTDTIITCYKKAFDAYWPIYETETEDVFKSDWSSKSERLYDIKAEAEFFKSHKGSSHNDSLIRYIGYVDNYDNAKRFVKNVYCVSMSDYENKLKQKDSFKIYPLTNNSSIMKKLDGVPDKAKQYWKDNIIWYVDETCSANDLYSFLDGFEITINQQYVKLSKNICDNKISDFHNKFYGELSYKETQLKNKWYELIVDAVNEACRIDNLSTFSNVYTDLINIIDTYGSDPNDLKGRLNSKYNELRGY